jgi:hypothetical protein
LGKTKEAILTNNWSNFEEKKISSLHYCSLPVVCTSKKNNGKELSSKVKYYKLIKKKRKFFIIYKECQKGSVAKSSKTNALLIYGYIFAHFLIYYEALPHI